MEPLLLDIPERMTTARLVLRLPRPGEGPEINAAVNESIDELKLWMPWAQKPPTLEESEVRCRKVIANFHARAEELTWHLHLGRGDGPLIGSIGIPRFNWAVPCYEIGYWLRTAYCGHGYMTEAVIGLTEMVFDRMKAERIEIRMDNLNERSWRVAERAGYALDAVFRKHERNCTGGLRDTRVYSRIRD